MIATRMMKKTPSAAEIHSGDSTHTHDQSMTLQSFSTINAIVSRPVKPMPLFVTTVLLLLLSFIVIHSFLLVNLNLLAVLADPLVSNLLGDEGVLAVVVPSVVVVLHSVNLFPLSLYILYHTFNYMSIVIMHKV